MTKVVIDPITRIEGHLRITVEVENGKVKDAWNTCTLFRGFEIFMETVDPRDTWQYAQRICGVCPNPHALNSATAAERAMGVDTVTDNARLVRNMLDATQIGYDSILWFYILNAFDYVNVPNVLNAKTTDPELLGIQDTVKRIATSGQTNPFSNHYWDHPGYVLPPDVDLLLTKHYIQSIQAQQWANEACAVIAGKFPMIMNMAAGGITQLPSLEEVKYYLDRMALVKQFTEEVMWNDLIAVAGAFPELATFGQGCGNFLTWGLLEDKSQDPYKRVFPRGAIFDKQLKNEKCDPNDIKLYTKHSYYKDSMGAGQHPFDVGQKEIEFTQWPAIDGPDMPSGKYDWTRAARYPSPAGKDVPMEVGPLSEVLVAYVAGQKDVVAYVDGVLAAIGQTGHPEVLVSNLGRVAARVIKARVNCDKAAEWGNQLLANMKAGDYECFTEPNLMAEGEGASGYDAPRGALSHYCRTKDGKVAKYATVPASNWNLAPRDDNGVRGPVEEALVGTPVVDPTKPLELLRTVHTFDP
ncbi:MAG: nickel-dependent hydrogenase large subunit [Coriobacteriia bacterium]|nr:nickel-dependent hydrogenase large subunit [Coriobacteriia bacterium]